MSLLETLTAERRKTFTGPPPVIPLRMEPPPKILKGVREGPFKRVPLKGYSLVAGTQWKAGRLLSLSLSLPEELNTVK